MERETDFHFQFPPGFRFHPSDEELITHYLLNKLKSNPLPADVIAENSCIISIHGSCQALFGKEEWFFFSPRDRKYPNGERPNRTASSGYWKATGTDKSILSLESKRIGVKKDLVFYTGRAPRGIKTNWIMSEYRLPDTSHPSKLKGLMRLDDWVLCRVRQKGNMSKNTWEDQSNPNKELIGYLPNIQELSPTNAYVNTNVIADLQFRGCQALSTMLSAQYLSQVETPLYQDGTYDADLLDIQRSITSSTKIFDFYIQDNYSSSLFNAITSLHGPDETVKISKLLEQVFTERQQF